MSPDGIETLRILTEFGRRVLRSGLKGRRIQAQGESLGASKTASTRGLKGRRIQAQGESLGASKTASTRGLKGRRIQAQGESLGASKTASTRGLKGRRNPSPGRIPGGVHRPNHPRPVGPQERIPGGREGLKHPRREGPQEPTGPARDAGDGWELRPGPGPSCSGPPGRRVVAGGRTQGFSLGWVPAALQAAGGSRALHQTG